MHDMHEAERAAAREAEDATVPEPEGPTRAEVEADEAQIVGPQEAVAALNAGAEIGVEAGSMLSPEDRAALELQGVELPPATLEHALLRVQEAAQELVLRRTEKGTERGSGRFDKYLSYPKLLAAVRPLLTQNGLVWQTFPTEKDGQPALRYRMTFAESGAFIEDTVLLILGKSQTSQAQGSAITYARRYALQAVLELAPDEDDDGQAASAPERPAPVDPEAPLSPRNLQAMQEAVDERGLQLDKVLTAAGVSDPVNLTHDDGRKVKAVLDQHDQDHGRRAGEAPARQS